MSRKIRQSRVTTRHALGEASANSDIAEFGLVFAETFLLSAVQFVSDGFTDGYMLGIQKHIRQRS